MGMHTLTLIRISEQVVMMMIQIDYGIYYKKFTVTLIVEEFDMPPNLMVGGRNENGGGGRYPFYPFDRDYIGAVVNGHWMDGLHWSKHTRPPVVNGHWMDVRGCQCPHPCGNPCAHAGRHACQFVHTWYLL
jgi:hypothetical protein